MEAHLIHNVNKELGGIFGEVIGQLGSVFVCSDLFNLRNDLAWNQMSIGLYVDRGMDG